MGETCGMKLIYNTVPTSGLCKMCENIAKKTRRYEKTKADYTRWYNDPSRKASAAKALEDMNALYQEINAIQAERQSRLQSVGNVRRNPPSRAVQ